ncbi:hypothetical protein IWQ62_004443 [Dispira parvispora]|uniref:DUF726-domain-containing protein n=1 Tax=Dispira parvispora TaxID=1520584 RepID=A0A9W8E0N0_9FUNG|nr:hypothetical protein IWQ62_004443 [Dispira parvispora]
MTESNQPPDTPLDGLLQCQTTLRNHWSSSQRVILASLCVQCARSLSCVTLAPTDDPETQRWLATFSRMVSNWLGLEDIDPSLFPQMRSFEESQEQLKVLAECVQQTLEETAEWVTLETVLLNVLFIALGFSKLPDLLETDVGQNPTVEPNAGNSSLATGVPSLNERTATVFEIADDEFDLDYALTPVLPNSRPTLPPVETPALHYDARSRAVVFQVANILGVTDQGTLLDLEKLIAQAVYFTLEVTDPLAAAESPLPAPGVTHWQTQVQQAVANDNAKNRFWRYVATGTATALGAAAIGLTAGLATPLVIAGLGALSISSFAFLSTAGGVALISSLFGLAGGGLTGYRMNRRVKGLSEFAFSELFREDEKLPVPSLVTTILVPGFLTDPDDLLNLWRPCFDTQRNRLDYYVLRYDPEVLLNVGNAFSQLLSQEAVTFAAGQVVQQTVLATLASALAWPLVILKCGQLIDNPWALGLARAKRAGCILAEVLWSRAQGQRPTLLVGYSLGALVIYYCLVELAARGGHGLVDTVVLLGGPFQGNHRLCWTGIRQVVSRRIINGYSHTDWLLGYLYRVQSLRFHMAGLSGIEVGSSDSVPLNPQRSPGGPASDSDIQYHTLGTTFPTKEPLQDTTSRNSSSAIKDEKQPIPPPDSSVESHMVNDLGIENIDLSDIVTCHSDYAKELSNILERLQLF